MAISVLPDFSERQLSVGELTLKCTGPSSISKVSDCRRALQLDEEELESFFFSI